MDHNALMVQMLLDRQADIEQLRTRVRELEQHQSDLYAELAARDQQIADLTAPAKP